MKRIDERRREANKGAATEAKMEEIKVGMRCRLSALGLKKMPRQSRLDGTVVGVGRTINQVRVRFDGYKSAQTLHRSYLEEIPQCGGQPES